MDPRTHELITSFLLRDTTPEQEKELFAACMTEPGLADLLRDEMALSLELRSLRDATVVPAALAAELRGRINMLEAQSAAKSRRRLFTLPERFALPRFSWAQLGTAAAAPALAVAAFFLFRGGDLPVMPVSPSVSTVTVVRTDTVTQVREVRTPVYIVRHEAAPAPGAVQSPDVATRSNTGTSTETAAAAAGTEPAAQPASLPAIAQSERERSYLDQYNEMLVTVESVHITDGDRIRN
jgi:hypothetical protein